MRLAEGRRGRRRVKSGSVAKKIRMAPLSTTLPMARKGRAQGERGGRRGGRWSLEAGGDTGGTVTHCGGEMDDNLMKEEKEKKKELKTSTSCSNFFDRSPKGCMR